MAAVLLSRVVSAAQIMEQKVELDTTCPLSSCLFGFSAAIHGNRAVIGAPGNHTAYAFTYSESGWQRTQVLTADALVFGSSVALSDEWLAIGTAEKYGGDKYLAGSVHMYRWSEGSWAPWQVLVASDPTALFEFGRQVLVQQDLLFVGVPKHSSEVAGIKWAGVVYVFEWRGESWQQVQLIHSPDPSESGFFGDSISCDGRTLLIGQANYSDGASGYKPGAVFVYESAAGKWILTQTLHASDGGPGDEFGATNSVAISNGRALIGSWGFGSQATGVGKVYEFENGPQGWFEVQHLLPADPGPWSLFGNGVAMDGDDAVIGCRGDGDLASGAGSAYHFRLVDGQWTQVGKLLAVDGEEGDDLAFFGVALNRQRSLIGAPAEDGSGGDDKDGAAYFFDLSTAATQYCSCPSAGPCGNRDDHGGCMNSTSQGGVLAAAGSGSTANDDLRLESRWLPPREVAVTFMGSAATSLPFNDGVMCVGPGVLGLHRFTAGATGPGGAVLLGPGIVSITHSNFPPNGQIQPGQAWYFQTWYRDQSGLCGTGANLTNGVKVEFTP